jgi:hypothetical protein
MHKKKILPAGKIFQTYNKIFYYFFLVVSADAFILEVSVVVLEVSTLVTVVSLVLTVVESVVVVEVPELLQATNTVATARIAKNFFMTSCFKGFL